MKEYIIFPSLLILTHHILFLILLYHNFRLYDANIIYMRQLKGKQAAERAELRKTGIGIDKYGGKYLIPAAKQYPIENHDNDNNNDNSSNFRKRKSENEVSNHNFDKQKIERSNKAQKYIRFDHHEDDVQKQKIVTHGKTKVFLKGPSVDGNSKQNVSNANQEQDKSLHPSWVAKQNLKSKLSNITFEPQGKKIKFSEDD